MAKANEVLQLAVDRNVELSRKSETGTDSLFATKLIGEFVLGLKCGLFTFEFEAHRDEIRNDERFVDQVA
jgi:hypothetical protein